MKRENMTIAVKSVAHGGSPMTLEVEKDSGWKVRVLAEVRGNKPRILECWRIDQPGLHGTRIWLSRQTFAEIFKVMMAVWRSRQPTAA